MANHGHKQYPETNRNKEKKTCYEAGFSPLTLEKVSTFTSTVVFPLLYRVLMSPKEIWSLFKPVAVSPWHVKFKHETCMARQHHKQEVGTLKTALAKDDIKKGFHNLLVACLF